VIHRELRVKQLPPDTGDSDWKKFNRPLDGTAISKRRKASSELASVPRPGWSFVRGPDEPPAFIERDPPQNRNERASPSNG